MEVKPDFSGWATKANLKCTDGRTITSGAFKHQDKETVPLVWQHLRNQPENILGHAVLEHRDEGVYCYGYFNDTDSGVRAKKIVNHRDVNSLSIYANQLMEQAKSVMHGMIREVSLVVAGANPGARIEFITLEHSDRPNEDLEDEAVIRFNIELEHIGDEDEQVEEVTEKVEDVEHADESGDSVAAVLDTLNEKQQNVVFYLLAKAAGLTGSEDSAEHADGEPPHIIITPKFNSKGFITSQTIKIVGGDEDLEQSDNVEDWLEHFGVKGMKWGVRKDRGHEGEKATTKQIAKADKKYEKSFSGVAGYVKIQNQMAEHINAKIGSLNDKYAGQDVSDGKPAQKKYLKDYEKIVDDADKAATTAFGTNASGTGQVKVSRHGEGYESTWKAEWEDLKHADSDAGPTDMQEILESLDERQATVVHYMLDQGLQYAAVKSIEDEDSTTAVDSEGENTAAHADNQEGNTVTRNIFEQNDSAGSVKTGTTLTHAQQADIFKMALDGELRLSAAVARYAGTLEHGIESIDTLFPDARAVTSSPEFLSRRVEWVNKVLTGTRHTPFAKIKSLTANLTLEEARAKGYVKGTLKKEEFFPVAKRETLPQTIYKKQKLDRDDIIDITDFDVVAWLKGEMRLMLDEELARAILVGDGRDPGDEDKIREDRVRPISTDNDLFVTRLNVNIGDASSSAEEVVDAVVRGRRHYRGTGNPVLFTSESLLADLLLVKDTLGRRIYADTTALKAAMRVSDIITVEIMDDTTNNVLGIIVNLQDYVVGADKGGDVALFDDFDIDYNQYKYLIETRCSGALVKAKSALVLMKTAANAVLATPVAPTFNTGTKVTTIPTTTGVNYYNKTTGALLTAGAQTALTAGQELRVEARPSGSGYYFPTDANDEFLVTYEDGVTSPGV